MIDDKYSPPPPPSRDNVRLISFAVAGVALVVAVIVALTTFGGGSSDSANSDTGGYNNPQQVDPASDTPADQAVTDQNGSDLSVPSDTSIGDSASPSADLETYEGPEGITASGPPGWRTDRSANIRTVLDFDKPGSSARLAGATFRIGVGNPNPSGSFQQEASAAAAFLRKTYGANIIGGVQFSSFRGTESGDIEYEYFNTTYNVNRHGIERLWRENGQTYIIQSSGTSDQWSEIQQVFSNLTESAQVN